MVIDGIHLTVFFMRVLDGQEYVITPIVPYIGKIAVVPEIAIIMRRVANEATHL